MTDVHPIALCNVLYNILAKVLANRLKTILPVIISKNQSAFVPGQSITDNVLIAFEIIHYMKMKNTGQKGEVALKLDISKAYDRVDWNYLKHMMEDMGFAVKWISWMLLYVTTVQYMVCFNGTLVGPISPGCGLRQDDPLSPYLFLFCVEGLSHSIRSAAINDDIHGHKISSNAPAITHLLFVDDSFLFFKANHDETQTIKNLLNSYERLSGQAVNCQKSGIFFSANVRRDKQHEIMEILAINIDLCESYYLVLPYLVGRSKKWVFSFLKERVWKRIQGWYNKLLSKAGKTVLIKNVAQSIPSYCMSCFHIPKSLCQEIERIMNNYWWTSNNNNRKGIKWLAWDKICMAKSNGWLGFRSLHGFNLALLGDGSSFIWARIWEAKESLCKGYRWVLGDGKNISIFKDPWLRGKRDFKVEDHHSNNTRGDKVCEYFRPNIKEWDVQKVQQTFHTDDVPCILRTRIPQNEAIDRLAWLLASNEKYSIKTEYQYWKTQQNSITQVNIVKGWSRIWKIEVPHKTQIFLWRFCKNNIHVRNLLRGRGVSNPIGCPMCERDIEHVLHLFFDCDFASKCSQKVGLIYDMRDVESAAEWLLDKLSTESIDNVIIIEKVLAGIWFVRNKRVWEGKQIDSNTAIEMSSKQIVDWQDANKKPQESLLNLSTADARMDKWVALELGWMKLNVDALVYDGD